MAEVWGEAGAELGKGPDRVPSFERLGLMLGHLPGEIWLVRGGKCVGSSSPSLGGKHSVSQEAGPNLGPPRLFIPGLLSFSGLFWPLNPVLSWRPEWRVQPLLRQERAPAAGHQAPLGLGSLLPPSGLSARALGLTDQKHVLMAGQLQEEKQGILGLSSALALSCCMTVVPVASASPQFSRGKGPDRCKLLA